MILKWTASLLAIPLAVFVAYHSTLLKSFRYGNNGITGTDTAHLLKPRGADSVKDHTQNMPYEQSVNYHDYLLDQAFHNESVAPPEVAPHNDNFPGSEVTYDGEIHDELSLLSDASQGGVKQSFLQSHRFANGPLDILESSVQMFKTQTNNRKKMASSPLQKTSEALKLVGGSLLGISMFTGPAAPFVAVAGAVFAGASGLLSYCHGEASPYSGYWSIYHGFEKAKIQSEGVSTQLKQIDAKLDFIVQKVSQISDHVIGLLRQPYFRWYRISAGMYEKLMKKTKTTVEDEHIESECSDTCEREKTWIRNNDDHLEREWLSLYPPPSEMVKDVKAKEGIASAAFHMHQLLVSRSKFFAFRLARSQLDWVNGSNGELKTQAADELIEEYHSDLELYKSTIRDLDLTDWMSLSQDDLTEFINIKSHVEDKVQTLKAFRLPQVIQCPVKSDHCVTKSCKKDSDACLNKAGVAGWLAPVCVEKAEGYCAAPSHKNIMISCCPGVCQRVLEERGMSTYMETAPCKTGEAKAAARDLIYSLAIPRAVYAADVLKQLISTSAVEIDVHGDEVPSWDLIDLHGAFAAMIALHTIAKLGPTSVRSAVNDLAAVKELQWWPQQSNEDAFNRVTSKIKSQLNPLNQVERRWQQCIDFLYLHYRTHIGDSFHMPPLQGFRLNLDPANVLQTCVGDETDAEIEPRDSFINDEAIEVLIQAGQPAAIHEVPQLVQPVVAMLKQGLLAKCISLGDHGDSCSIGTWLSETAGAIQPTKTLFRNLVLLAALENILNEFNSLCDVKKCNDDKQWQWLQDAVNKLFVLIAPLNFKVDFKWCHADLGCAACNLLQRVGYLPNHCTPIPQYVKQFLDLWPQALMNNLVDAYLFLTNNAEGDVVEIGRRHWETIQQRLSEKTPQELANDVKMAITWGQEEVVTSITDQ